MIAGFRAFSGVDRGRTARAVRDANDAAVLGTLLAALQAGAADYLITGDKDRLAPGDRFPIVTPAAFRERHGSL